MSILAVNAGSSSIKFALYPRGPRGQLHEALTAGRMEGLEPGGQPRLSYQDLRADNTWIHRDIEAGPGEDAFQKCLALLYVVISRALAGTRLEAIIHRIVHGGPQFRETIEVTPEVLLDLEKLSIWAPIHHPRAIDAIRRFQGVYPEMMQLACFDTAFHDDLPEEEVLLALPQALRDSGLRRYGFHGLSYDYLRHRLAELSSRAQGRVVMAHLGGGASLCALKAGKSIATTMGFSTLDGLMMGTRSGTVDPGVILHLLAQGMDHEALQHLLYEESGLLGVSGESADMRTLRASRSEDAKRAIRLFTYRVRRELGAMMAVLGGLDVLVFTGGIGENDAILRRDVLQGLEGFSVQWSDELNQHGGAGQPVKISLESSAVEVWIIPTDEARMAASYAASFLEARSLT